MKQFIAIVLLLPLAGCFADRESQWIPSDIAPLFGGGAAAPARPLPAQPAPGSQAPGYNGQPLVPGELRIGYNEPGKIETHAVTHPNLCRQMEQQFIMQGRKLRLHRIRRTTNPGLRYDCEFKGEDAVEGWFNDRRYGRDR